MKQEDLSLAKEKIASSFKELSIASSKLNAAAEALTATVSDLEKLLKTLNLRVSAWHPLSRTVDDEGVIRTRAIGYANVEGKWGIAIRKTVEDPHAGEYDEEIWPFADAPRWMCADAVGKLPDVVSALLERTIETTENIKTKNEAAKQIVAATATAAAEIMSTTGRRK